ncbi:hypothetical protein CBR_g29510 [Chara braunii]|uniref:Pectate lyase domain-containing protein n=1 Tax=Chara braunii TaxID=69332 RepID=A0A388LAZ2_CHABU|nr:hypothetical protein CBR_g29510 [Chara braunii]|eukprot:GBG79362.1 hypothetical protein CBR_g29510 [Chara braunii]
MESGTRCTRWCGLSLAVLLLFLSSLVGLPTATTAAADRSSAYGSENAIRKLLKGKHHQAATADLAGAPGDVAHRELDESLTLALAKAGQQYVSDSGGYFGFGEATTGGAGGDVVFVTNFADSGISTLRYWCGLPGKRIIKFDQDCTITLKSRVECTNDKTVDGSGYKVRITGWGLSANRVSNVVFKNLCIAKTKLDGVTIRLSSRIVVQGCTISGVGDGGTDVITHSSEISILNNHYTHMWKTILLGNSDKDTGDTVMSVTVAFNFFDGCISRLPRARFGRVHVCANSYLNWGTYAIGASEKAHLLVENCFFHPAKNKYVNNLHEGLNDGTVIEYRSNTMNDAKLLLTHLGKVDMPYTCPVKDESTIRSQAGVPYECI